MATLDTVTIGRERGWPVSPASLLSVSLCLCACPSFSPEPRTGSSCISLQIVFPRLPIFTAWQVNGAQFLSPNDSLHMEDPGLRGVYANGSANAGPTKEAGGAESPKPDTDAQWVQNCSLKSQKFRTRDAKMKQSLTSYQRAGASWIPDAPAQDHLSGDTQNQRVLEPASPKHQNSEEGFGLLPQAAFFLAISSPAEVTPRLTLNAPPLGN